jgi:hypothetical protein
MASRLSIKPLLGMGEVILFEGIETPTAQGLKASRSATYQRKKQGFYARFFQTNSAPMLLIDPSRDGLIVDANLSALNFYGYTHDAMCQKHTWEINMLGRHILPVMHKIAHLPGGHKPCILSINWLMGLPVMCKPTPDRSKFTVINSCCALFMILPTKAAGTGA